jgi:holin-like protein
MIQGLVVILFFQGLGEVVARFFQWPVPGPVVGLMALLAYLLWKREIPHDVDQVAGQFSQHLGLLFIPASVGVVKFMPQLKAWGLSLAVILVLSVALSIGLVAWLLKRMAPDERQDREGA